MYVCIKHFTTMELSRWFGGREMDSTYRLVTFFSSSEENRSLPLTIHSVPLPSSFSRSSGT